MTNYQTNKHTNKQNIAARRSLHAPDIAHPKRGGLGSVHGVVLEARHAVVQWCTRQERLVYTGGGSEEVWHQPRIPAWKTGAERTIIEGRATYNRKHSAETCAYRRKLRIMEKYMMSLNSRSDTPLCSCAWNTVQNLGGTEKLKWIPAPPCIEL